MSNNIEYQFEFLCHAMRMQLEQIVKYPDLVDVDEKEAIFNVEISIKSTLDAFHNVYDAIREYSNKSINWYDYPELHFILSLRNAKHHNKGVKSIFFEDKDCFYIDFLQKNRDILPCIIYPLRWVDIYNYIKSDKKGARKYKLLENYLNINLFEKELDRLRLPKESIYINIIPLMLQAGFRLLNICKEYIPKKLDSCEAETFINLFEMRVECVPKYIYPYNKGIYKSDIDNINKLSEMRFGKDALYLKDIRYDPL